MVLSIIIPTHNEAQHIGTLVQKLQQTALPSDIKRRDIIVVDDGSSDETASLARDAGALVVTHSINLGKGSTLKTGCEVACRMDADILITMDGDGQHDAQDLHEIVMPLVGGVPSCDIVLGTRSISEDMPATKRIGNRFLNVLVAGFLHLDIKDTQSGFRAFTREAYKKIKWTSTDYFVETEMLAAIKHHGLRYTEVPISTIYHDNYKGTTVFDGIKIFCQILHLKFRRSKS